MSDARTKRAVEIQESIRQILFYDWDPIGVKNCSTATDEYDSCIAPVYRILVGSRSEEDLINFLHANECESIGMPSEASERLRTVARKLLAVDVSL